MEVFKRLLKLKPEYFRINGSNLERLALFNTSTTVLVLDPTVVNPTDSVPLSTVDGMTTTFTTDLAVTASNYLDTTWTGNGWNLSSDAAIDLQVREWAFKNLNTASNKPNNLALGNLHVITMRGNIDGSDYTLFFMYTGNDGGVLANPLQNNDITDYTLTEANGGTVTFSNGCLTHSTSATAGSEANAAQDFTTIIGNRYQFHFEIASITGNNLLVNAIDTNPTVIESQTFGSTGFYFIEFFATTATTTIEWGPDALSTDIEVCPIKLIEVFGPYLLNEDGSILLAENNDEILLEA